MKKIFILLLLPIFCLAAAPDSTKLDTLQRQIKQDVKNENLRIHFAQVASGVDLSSLRDSQNDNQKDLVGELKDLASPLIQSVKRVSEQPRKIESLKNKIMLYQEQMEKIKQSHRVITDLMAFKKYKPYRNELTRTIRWLENKNDQLTLELDSSQSQLKKIQSERRSIVDTFQDIVTTFLKTKGKNLVIAVLGFVAILLGMSFIRKKIFGHNLFGRHFEVVRKPLQAIYTLLTFFLAIICAMICLYVLNDWLLVTVIIFVLMGLAWSLKNFIPQFFDEIKLILNFGTVREGEKIYLDGIPWKVEKLSFYSRLSNRELEGGVIRVSSKKLLGNYSRKISNSEPWFPTQKGDWILLNGESLARVKMQSPDQVIIDKIGGGEVHYNCCDFLAEHIENLSRGYSVTGSFGLDYQLQKEFSQNLLDYFKEGFTHKLENLEGVEAINVDFNDCGADSLNIFVRADFSGAAAKSFRANQRFMQKAFLDLCNQRDYAIPFKQLTVHLNNGQ